MTAPRVYIAPVPAPAWAAEAVQAGGGQVVDDPAAADAAVWLAFWDPAGSRALVEAVPGLRWVQLPAAGIEHFFESGVITAGPPVTWTAAQGAYGPQCAEHALALLLAGLRHLHTCARATSWGRPEGTSLFGRRVTILGGGGIARSLLGLLGPFGVEATVVRRQPEPVAGAARTVTPDRLPDALAGADAVVLALALTPQTRGVIAEAELRAMEDHAWLVNVARGGHVVTGDLVRALDEGWIGGAALDVTDPEPLPDGHPLWGHPRCIITPHAANTIEMAQGPLAERIRENVRRFAAGEELLGVVDLEHQY